METDPFDGALDLEPLYEPGERFLEAFYEFAYRVNSLHRHWVSTRRFIARYLTSLRAINTDGSGEMGIFKDELLLADQEYLPEFLRGAVLSHSFAVLENMLDDVAAEVASELGAKVALDQRPLPYINRYILFLTRSCGLKLEVSTDLWRQLDAVRELRNRYIHKLDRDLPAQIKATLEDIAAETRPDDSLVDDAFVDRGLEVIVELGEAVETAFWQWHDGRQALRRA
jgi:hypothetical protein